VEEVAGIVASPEEIAMNAPARPRVICHMMATVDGRIVTGRWPELGEGLKEYERTGATLGGDAWMCGRVTMERHFASGVRPSAAPEPAGAERADFVAPGAHAPYAVALDAAGRLRWGAGSIEGDHVIVVMGDGVPDAHLAALRETGVSYLFAPAAGGGVDLAAALDRLAALFGIRTLLLEGGGGINGSMLRAGLVDEVSLLLAPVADGTAGTASLFDAAGEAPGRRLRLESVERRAEDVLWLRYRVENEPPAS
jgi:2,5-diamino-6-(ribosylamino)-4(3H)-pyrimidinone 5'-phosphate reductase